MRSIITIAFSFSALICLGQKHCKAKTKSFSVVYCPYNNSLLDSIQTLRFEAKNKKRFIPAFIKQNLKCWNNKKFRIANPGKPYNVGDAIVRNWPTRRLNYLGINNFYIILCYEHGGFGHHQHILIFKVNKKSIEKFYNLDGPLSVVKSIEDIVLSLKLIDKRQVAKINPIEF